MNEELLHEKFPGYEFKGHDFSRLKESIPHALNHEWRYSPRHIITKPDNSGSEIFQREKKQILKDDTDFLKSNIGRGQCSNAFKILRGKWVLIRNSIMYQNYQLSTMTELG